VTLALAITMVALGACQQQPPPPPPTTQVEPAPAPTYIPPTATVEPAAPTPAPIVTDDGRVRVGLLLPLSGQHAVLGESMLHAAEMALFDADNDRFALVVHDTEGPGGAVGAAQQAIGEGARLILGPLFAQQVTQVAPVARAAGVPVVSFSTDRSVAGSDIYVMGIMPELQVQRVVAFAASQGYPRIAALLPSTAYGRAIAQALQQSVSPSVQVGAVEFYDTGTTDLAPYVRRIAESRGSYDALLVPEGGDRLRLIAPLLPFYDIDPSVVRMLGSTLWDDVRLGSESGLAGGWFAAPPAESWQRFEQRYGQYYGTTPARLSTLAYDGTALAAVLARSAGPEATAAGAFYNRESLTRSDGFAGIDGIFRFRADGSVERGLAVMELQYGQIVTVDPAPQSFQDVIY
jgi:ABC-type branched-subunit amino acid transport system substrate-binding protein